MMVSLARAPNFPRPKRVARKVHEGLRQRGMVPHRDQPAIVTISDQLALAAGIGRDHRQAGGHCFHGGIRQPFMDARLNVGIRRLHVGGNFIMRDRADEDHPGRSRQLSDELRFNEPPHDHQLPVGRRLAEALPSLDQIANPLALDDGTAKQHQLCVRGESERPSRLIPIRGWRKPLRIASVIGNVNSLLEIRDQPVGFVPQAGTICQHTIGLANHALNIRTAMARHRLPVMHFAASGNRHHRPTKAAPQVKRRRARGPQPMCVDDFGLQ